MRLARKVPLSRGTATIPVLSALAVANWVNPTDFGQKPLSDMQWTGVHLTVEELAVIVAVPESVIEDEAFDVMGEVQPSIGEAIAEAIDQAVLFGVNAPVSWPAGGIYSMARGAAAARRARPLSSSVFDSPSLHNRNRSCTATGCAADVHRPETERPQA